jgi:glycosyltransferase involved in cell wall biosynthesis
MKIFIPILFKEKKLIEFSYGTQNPGIGGTEFTSIKLALLLARKYPDLDISLVSMNTINLTHESKNLENIVVDNLEDFLDVCSIKKDPFLIVSTMSIAISIKKQLLKKLSPKTIIWLRHPFQLVPEVKNLGCVAHVHVGEYQFHSNKTFYPSSWFIQNPFFSCSTDAGKAFPPNNGVIKIIYLGALFQVKGFGHLARQWSAIKNVLPDVELHVIGSSATYGKPPEHPIVPCDSDFAEEILKHIPLEDIEAGKVVFHGNLGQEKFEIMRSAHFAILNPTGASEAFPASPLECMACGLPVIASDDYGMSDSMRFFPELILRSPEDIPGRVQFLLSDRYRYEELSARSVAVATWFDSQNDVILARWRRLFDVAVKARGQALPDCPPSGPPYGSRLELSKRQMWAQLGMLKRTIYKRLRNTKSA